MLENVEIRNRAREYMAGKWNTCAVIWLIYFVFSGISGAVPGLGVIVSLLISGPISLSLAIIFLKITRGEDIAIEMLFKGFEDFTRSFVAMLLTSLYVILWSCLLIVPGIIAGISYSMTWFILSENPDISANDAIRRSKEMMMGHKTEFLWLSLSFLGWFLLGIITCSIAMLWVGSYYSTATAIFYQEIKGSETATQQVM